MERSLIVRVALAALVAAALSLGCATTPDDAGITTADEGFGEGLDDRSGPYGENVDRVADPSLDSVYFDFDMALIRDDQKPTLRTNATSIQNNASWTRITVEGHCDERGSEEYNLALGERRASAVKRYLTTLGVPEVQVDTVSFGESKPAVPGHEESVYRWNRRAEFRVSR